MAFNVFHDYLNLAKVFEAEDEEEDKPTGDEPGDVSSLALTPLSPQPTPSTPPSLPRAILRDRVTRDVRDCEDSGQKVKVKALATERSCVFCRKNGETRKFYETHVLKDGMGRIICPILRRYVCPRCGATGDHAHTLRHCPEGHGQGQGPSTFSTRRTSCGYRKRPQ